MSKIAIMCKCVKISLCVGCVEQNVVQNVPSLTKNVKMWIFVDPCRPPSHELAKEQTFLLDKAILGVGYI